MATATGKGGFGLWLKAGMMVGPYRIIGVFGGGFSFALMDDARNIRRAHASSPHRLFVLALPLLAGCSALNVQTHLNVEGTAEGTTVERDVSVGEDGVTWRDVTDGQDDISLSNHEGYHLIRWQAEGHFPRSCLCPERRNPLKFLDVGTLVGGALDGARHCQREQRHRPKRPRLANRRWILHCVFWRTWVDCPSQKSLRKHASSS